MGKVVYDITASLDGFVAGPNDGPQNPLGDGGMRLFDWYFSSPDVPPTAENLDPEFREAAAQAVGAIVSGRRTYDIANGWNGQHPIGARFFVVTHHLPNPLPQNINGEFVTDGVASAIRRAQAVAGDKIVAVASPDIARQCLKAGLLDELSLHFVPVLIGAGVRLFDHLGTDHVELECTQATNTPKVLHTTYRVLK